ncbi:unnamed protein product, partial [Staurois parvus]
MYVKCFDTVMFYYVIFFKIFKSPTRSIPICPDVTGNGTRKTDAGIGRRTLPGKLQGD